MPRMGFEPTPYEWRAHRVHTTFYHGSAPLPGGRPLTFQMRRK